MAACTVLAGAADPTVADVKRVWQEALCCAGVALSTELTHAPMISASVLISLRGTVAPAGMAAPGTVPAATFMRVLRPAKALARPCRLVELEPTLVRLDIKGERDQTVAMVVSSFTETYGMEPSALQGPRPTMRASALLFWVPGTPGLPPVAAR
jgi:hypothetical protein